MKKKILALCLVVVLAITAVTGATLAYFTDSDKATNTFVVGNVKIYQNEQQRVLGDTEVDNDAQHQNIRVTGDNLEDFENGKNAKPAVLNKLGNRENLNVNGYPVSIRNREGNYIDKIVSVTNEGTEPAYVRTIIAVPNMNGFDDDSDATYNPLHWNFTDAVNYNGTGWDWNGNKDAVTNEDVQKQYVSAVTIDGKSYDIYVATYNTAVAAGATTAPSMVGFYLHPTVGYDEGGYFYLDKANAKKYLNEWMVPGEDGKVELKFLVASQACQIDGFADAWEALDTAFGKIDENAVKELFKAD